MNHATSSPSSKTMKSNAETKQTGFPVHLVFAIVLLSILMLKYYLYFASPHTGTGITGTRIGATIGHLLMWAFAYIMCLQSTNRMKMGLLAAPTLFFGVLTVPLFGYLGLMLMYFFYRKEKKK